MAELAANVCADRIGCAASAIQPQYTLNGALHRRSRDEKLLTPSGPEGSSGSSGFGCRVFAGVKRLPLSSGPGYLAQAIGLSTRQSDR